MASANWLITAARALVAFPDATEITTISLELAGDPRRIKTLKPEALGTSLAALRVEIGGLLSVGSNTSVNLSAQQRNDIPGQVASHLMGLVTAGYEGLEAHGVPPGVVVANAGDSWSPTVAEHAMMLMLALIRRLPMALAAQARSAWESPQIAPGIRSLRGRTLVIVGYGSIGREAALRARGFGMRIVGVSRSARPDPVLDEVRRAGLVFDHQDAHGHESRRSRRLSEASS